MSRKKTFIPISSLPKLKGSNLLEYIPKSSKNNLINHDNVNSKNQESFFTKKFICIAVKDDSSQIKAIKAYIKEVDIVFLEYDLIGYAWDFYFINNKLIFIVNNNYLIPLGIYNRPFIPKNNDPRYEACLNFNIAIELWNGYKINCGIENYHNSSKPLQTSFIAKHINKTFKKIVNIPNSLILKTKSTKAKDIVNQHDLIVKSCSGIRSKVESNKIFHNWNYANLKNIPTFFQEQIHGIDLRIHPIKDHIYSVQIKEKSGTDYRYNKNSGYDLVEAPKKIQNFCKILKNLEKLNLVGIDFIMDLQTKIYYVLECNPNPGWAGFHRKANQEQDLAKDLINV